MDRSTAAAISRMFSSSVIQEMSRYSRSGTFGRLLSELGTEWLTGPALVRDVFDEALRRLSVPGVRDEYVFKSAIVQKVLLGRHSINSASLLSEVRIAGNRADLVVLNGTATVYEIKSDRDNLTRLPAQLAAYLRAFATVCVITSDELAEAIVSNAPRDVGVLTLNRRGSISQLRAPISRPDRIDPITTLDALRTAEAISVLQHMGIQFPDVPNTERYGLVRSIFMQQDAAELHSAVVSVLKVKRKQTPLSDLLQQLPRSLHAAALTVPMRKADHGRLVDAINKPLEEAIFWN